MLKKKEKKKTFIEIRCTSALNNPIENLLNIYLDYFPERIFIAFDVRWKIVFRKILTFCHFAHNEN